MPFILSSYFAEAMWKDEKPESFEVLGTAPETILKNCINKWVKNEIAKNNL
jgi:hypothetical protein